MIYSCQSKTWKRLTSAHSATQLLYRSASRAEQTSQRSAGSGALRAYINTWASDEEKLVLKHLRGTNVHENRSHFQGLLTTLQMREGAVWLAGYNCPVIIRKKSRRPLLGLCRAVLRIRTTVHPDCIAYDMDGLLRTLQARAMLGILENRIRGYLSELRFGVKSFIKKTQVRYVLRILRFWGVRGKCDSAYGEVLKMLVFSCKTGSQRVVVNLDTLATIPSLTVDTRSGTELQRYMDRMPRTLANAPVHKQVCWHCKNVVESPLRKCAGCKRARYCSRICQVEGWGDHQRACLAVASFLSRQLIEGVMFDEVSVHQTWGSFLPEHIDQRLKK